MKDMPIRRTYTFRIDDDLIGGLQTVWERDGIGIRAGSTGRQDVAGIEGHQIHCKVRATWDAAQGTEVLKFCERMATRGSQRDERTERGHEDTGRLRGKAGAVMSKRRKLAERTLADGRTVVARINGGIRKRCGCPPSAWNDCRHPWHANYSHDGIEHRVSLQSGRRRPTTTSCCRPRRRRSSGNGRTQSKPARPLPHRREADAEAVATRYIADYVEHPDRRPGRAEGDGATGRVLVKAFGSGPIAAITKPIIEDFRTARRTVYETSKGRCCGSRAAPGRRTECAGDLRQTGTARGQERQGRRAQPIACWRDCAPLRRGPSSRRSLTLPRS